MNVWKKTVEESQRLKLSYVHYAPTCSLQLFAKNITHIYVNDYNKTTINSPTVEQLLPLIAKYLGVSLEEQTNDRLY